MSLSGLQYQQIRDALIAAFGDEDNLRQMLKLQMSIDLALIARPGNMADRTFEVVTWADKNGRVLELVESALHENPGNPELQSLARVVKDWHIEPPAEAELSPYKGLLFYDRGDADLFFGREKLTTDLVTYLKDHRFLAVIGASGSGKSSVVRAGIIPALEKGGVIKGSATWLPFVVTPTARPITALAAVLTKASESVTAQTTLMDDLYKDVRSLDLYASRLIAKTGAPRMLLVVDQFEELFTLCKDHAEQQAYIDNLLTAAAPDGVTTVILTLRADFYARCAEFANLRLALQDCQKYIGPMSHEELRTAIEKPAKQNGWDFEPGLVDAVLSDVEGEAGALPLLSEALTKTWEQRSGRTLTFAGYHAVGGVQGAIAHTADEVYAELSPDQQAIARNIFLRLTTLGEGTQDTRRRVPLPELLGNGEKAVQVQAVLKKLEDERLVTAERAPTMAATPEGSAVVYVDVTHEALIRAWPMLDKWLREDRAGLVVHRRLTEAAQEWDTSQPPRDPSPLFRGVRLAQTAEWAKTHDVDLNDLEREFLNASQAQADAAKRRRQGLVAGIVLGTLIFGVAMALLAWTNNNLRNTADLNAAEARHQAALAEQAKATTQANLDLAQAELARQEGTKFLRESIALAAGGRLTEAIALYDEAMAADPMLPVKAAEAITGTIRVEATRLITEGEELARSSDNQGAAGKFRQALALQPPPDTPVYVWIEPSTFMMGSTDEQCKNAGVDNCNSNEQPAHTVTLDGFWIQRTEVTNEQYRRCVDAGKCEKPDNGYWDKPAFARTPVTDVDWRQASAYAAWVGGRLPTEAEWEYACRGTDGRTYPWGDDPPTPKRSNYNFSVGTTTEVGSYPPGAHGLYDMAGNVWEWTADWYEDTYYKSSPGHNPTGPEHGDGRTLRGGSWYLGDRDVRCAIRDVNNPDSGSYNVGFRIVLPGF